MSPLLGQQRAVLRRDRRALGRLGLGGVLLLATARCTFPEYETAPSSGGTSAAEAGVGATSNAGSALGGAGARGGAETGGTSILPADGGGGVAGASEPTGGSAGDPECAAEQFPVEHCAPGCLQRYPDHCYDGTQSSDELDVDCGGSCQRCTNEKCLVDSDCLSGKCAPDANAELHCYAPLGLLYTAHELNPSVSTTAWSLKLTNNEAPGGKRFAFKGIKLRYYFERAAAVEPLLMPATQSNLRLAEGQTQELSKTTWTIERTEAVPGVVYDAYVEVGFDDAGEFFPGDSIDLYQQLLTGDPSSSNFDQRAHYSYGKSNEAPSLHIAVLYAGQLVWGLEPRPANPRSCFYRGVNLNGPAVTVNDNAWQSSTQANVAPGGGSGVSQSTTLFPPATSGLSTMMQTAYRLNAGAELGVPTDNGTYLMFFYAVSPGNDGTPSRFTVQGVEPTGPSKFRSQAAAGGQAWARIGPFRVNVTDGNVRLGVSAGSIDVAGLELWYPD